VRVTLRAKIAALERSHPKADWGVIPFGDARIDSRLPGGGLARGRWHEIMGDGRERELPAAAAGLAAILAGKAARSDTIGTMIVWALERDDLHAPGLLAFGLVPDQVIFVRARNDAEVLGVMEDALRTRGVGAVVGELGALDLVAGKRLGLACERGGATAFVLRRRLHGARRGEAEDGSAATTRWRIGPASGDWGLGTRDWGPKSFFPQSPVPSPQSPPEPGLSAPLWAARLTRCRGGRTGAWIMEACDGTSPVPRDLSWGAPGDVRVVAELADHEAQTADGRGLSGRLPRACDHGDGGERAASSGGG
jgi:protein ImuA